MDCGFRKISQIDPELPDTYAFPNVFLTFDLDWAHDEVLADLLDLLDRHISLDPAFSCTFFVTHATPMLDMLRKRANYELGIHPNFNSLLTNSRDCSVNAPAETVVDRLLCVVPEAKSVRSHSLVSGSKLTGVFRRAGLTHESNMFVPAATRIAVVPFKHAGGMVVCPYAWGDYWACSLRNGDSCRLNALPFHGGIHIFTFHPIHVFLNTERIERYEETRPLHQRPGELVKYRFTGEGTRTRLLGLLNLASRQGQKRSLLV